MDNTPPRRHQYDDVAKARAAARKRWGNHAPANVKLHDLTEAQRRLVLALVAAARSERPDEAA